MNCRVIYHPYDSARNRYFLDGKEVDRETFTAGITSRLSFEAAPDGHRPSCWPMASDAAMLHPTQVADGLEACRQAGVPTEYLPDGRPVFTSASHRRAYCRKVEKILSGRAMYDLNGSFGDPSPE